MLNSRPRAQQIYVADKCTVWFQTGLTCHQPPPTCLVPLPLPSLMHEHLTEPWQGRDFLLLLPSYAGGRSSLALRISLTRLTRLTHTHTHSWHWPRSTVTVTTYPAYATGAAESCSRTFAAAPSSLSLSCSVSVSLWIMSIALGQWSSVQLLAHRHGRWNRSVELKRREGKEGRLNCEFLNVKRKQQYISIYNVCIWNNKHVKYNIEIHNCI